MQRCEHCKQRQARIELNMNVNGYHQKMHLCDVCYREVRQDMKQPSGLGGFGGQSPFDQMFQDMMHSQMGGKEEQAGQVQQGNGNGGLLDDLGKNLSDAARAGMIDPVIGRDKEVERVIETLNRRNKNNPVLIGEPGVGKTAIAEGLALKISEGNVPNKLKNKDIYLLDVSSLVANTGVRGQFEERMKQLLKELQERSNVIVFIDEVHQIVGAGSAEGSSDAGNIMKPALARGEIQVIGATTLAEYRKIEKDAALERRFQPVMVDEPNLEDAASILKGLQENYEKYHQVSFTDEAIKACVNLSSRYIQDRFLPDKAIDLMDEAGSKINLIHSEGDEQEIQSRLEQIAAEKEKATQQEDYERAAKLRDEEAKLQKQLEEAGQSEQQSTNKATVDVDTIEKIVENKTGIPVRRLQRDEQQKMKDLPERLNASVIGQEKAVQKVARSIRRNRAGLRKGTRPIGSFLFVGPTGVGKTELSKSLAEEMFGDSEAMIRLDMSEYMEKHSVSKLIGSPPGYVGHDEAGQLTEQVRRKPYSIILLDEIEKAHPDVQHMFLQIMEDGRLTDSQGRTVSFKDTVIIMTSNAGSGMKKVTVGFGNKEEVEPAITETLSDYFKPEFLNRFDSIVPFNELTKEDLISIVDLMLQDIMEAANEQNMHVAVTDEAKELLAELGYDPAFGARPLRRVIEEKVEDGIADLMLEEDNLENIQVVAKDNDIVVIKA
ncbi:ATP-dependent Clp protease ATP-binding subunit ClpE [Alteribacillus persepolensis]|uniref:ATP-dependent Clp protease ATP-binding subunit ClpE n=1 Tax=Alteribacillus persepolensis TaxID=568899 RepID=A0A1G8G6B2_9BACI|nr:ATP-dependent Clp protease ATP-binding subunit [Alteribacillus persepolensis]SDH89830.1 ATP-dependent Clp protease ATP-binding subunit ClpE [Alteribacillus persepolensis]